MAKLKRVLELGADIAMILICLAILAPIVSRYLIPIFEPSKIPQDSGLRIGSSFPALPNVSYKDHRLTVALFLNSRCIVCKESMPDYERLRSVIGPGRDSPAVYGIFDAHTETAQTIAALRFQLPTVRVRRFDIYHVSGTPTLVLIDQAGKIREFWVGKLTPNSQRNLIQIIKET